MKRSSLFAMPGLLFATAQAQNLCFRPPSGSTRETVSPASLSWSEDKIGLLHDYPEQKNTKALIVRKDAGSVISLSGMSGRMRFSETYTAVGDHVLGLSAYPPGIYTLCRREPDGRLYGNRSIITIK